MIMEDSPGDLEEANCHAMRVYGEDHVVRNCGCLPEFEDLSPTAAKNSASDHMSFEDNP